MAYEKLDKNGDGTVTLADLRDTYDVSFHPDVSMELKLSSGENRKIKY